jgi:lysophospholipase L1-like esterase
MKTTRQFLLLLLVVAVSTISQIAAAQGSPSYSPKGAFSAEIEAFLKEDSTKPPPKNAILFIGSSIFRLWGHLKEQMAPLPVFNRAFGGSRTGDVLDQMDRIVFPYAPRIIVYYCGSNDVNGGSRAAEIFLGFKQFAERVAEMLPGTHILYVSINRAPQKEDRWGIVDSANALVKEYCAQAPKREFIDVNPVLFDPDGKPRMDLYMDDKLHLREEAYVGFAGRIKPILQKVWASE